MSTDFHPIKVIDTAPFEYMRIDKIAIETAKNSKVTAVVVLMSLICRKKAVCGVLILETGSLLAKWQKVISF
jgi:hypothetical protein